jgi:hypothetical protein
MPDLVQQGGFSASPHPGNDHYILYREIIIGEVPPDVLFTPDKLLLIEDDIFQQFFHE